MGRERETLGRQHTWEETATMVGQLLLLLLLFSLLQTCSPFGSPKVRTILSEDKAGRIQVLPDGRRILHSGPHRPESLLDAATGEDIPLPDDLGGGLLDDELLYGEKDVAGVRHYYVINLRPMTVVWLEPLPGGAEALPGAIREADSIYAFQTGTDEYRLLLLHRDPSGTATQGYYIEDMRNLDTLLAGVPYKVPTLSGLLCPWREETPSPDGQYYFINGDDLRIYSRQGALLNADSRNHLECYGWAWDSSGVYVQEVNIGLGGAIIGPLELLLAKP
jgi:hypothetical protein